MQDMVADHLKQSQEFSTESQIRMKDLSDMVGSSSIQTQKYTLNKDPSHGIPDNEQSGNETEGMKVKYDTSSPESRPDNSPNASSHTVSGSDGVMRQVFFSFVRNWTQSELIVIRPTEVAWPGASDDPALQALNQVIESFIQQGISNRKNKHTTWEELQSNISSAEKQWEPKKKKGRLSSKVNKWRQGLATYHKGMPIVVHGHPGLESLIWGTFDMIIQVT